MAISDQIDALQKRTAVLDAIDARTWADARAAALPSS
jgi:hypothetical protein